MTRYFVQRVSVGSKNKQRQFSWKSIRQIKFMIDTFVLYAKQEFKVYTQVFSNNLCPFGINYFVVLHSKFVPGRLIVEVSRSHTISHAYPVVLLSTSDQLIAEADTYTTKPRVKHPCDQRDSKPRYQQSRDCRPMP